MKKTYLSYDRLKEYDRLIKAEIANGDTSSISSAKSYTDQQIQSVIDGDFMVSDAEHAESADEATHAVSADNATSATKATQDGNGKVISSTYETKTDATAKLTEAKAYTDTIASGKADAEHNHDAKYDKKGASDTAEANAKSYADSAIAKVKDDLLNGAGTAYDTLKELGDLIDTNVDAIDALETVASGKADVEHVHEIADVTGLQTTLDGKAASSHGTHVTYSTTSPVMDGTASVGSATSVARSDHKHPTDTSRAAQADLEVLEDIVAGKADSGHGHSAATTSDAGFMTADMVTKLNGIATGANKTIVDSDLSTTSTNPVQNNVVATSINANTQAISANTQSISAHTARITDLETKIGDGFEEITTAEIQALFNA